MNAIASGTGTVFDKFSLDFSRVQT